MRGLGTKFSGMPAWLFGIGLVCMPLVARAALTTTGSSRVSFAATGSMGMRISGTTHELSVSDDGTTIQVSVPLAHLVTGIDLRDEHMRDYLGVAAHPNAILTVPRSALVFPTSSETSGDATGTLELHGRTHAITFHYTAEPTSGSIHVSASTRIDMNHYGIAIPAYMGVEVNSRVRIETTFRVQDR